MAYSTGTGDTLTFNQFIDNDEDDSLVKNYLDQVEVIDLANSYHSDAFPLNQIYPNQHMSLGPQSLKLLNRHTEPMTDPWSGLTFDPRDSMAMDLSPIDTSGDTVNSQILYGQFTPPTSTASLFDVELQGMAKESISPSSIEHDRNREGLKRTTKTMGEPKKKARKSKTKKENSSKGSDEVDKRNKFLERNRVAASKCRQKKKEWTTNLDEEAKELQMNREALSQLTSSLREEVLYLKGELLRHSGCNCPEIKAYLHRQVGKIAGTGNSCTHCSNHKSNPSSPDSLESSTQATSPWSSDSSSSISPKLSGLSQ